jgi:FAM91 N-terminus
MQLFPYHLAEYVCRVMRVSPFRYYCDMIFEVMKNGTDLLLFQLFLFPFFSIFFLIFVRTLAEQPYDSIPNFSAADALRLTGIGRNEFIDIMNKCRSKVRPMLKLFCFAFLLLRNSADAVAVRTGTFLSMHYYILDKDQQLKVLGQYCSQPLLFIL